MTKVNTYDIYIHDSIVTIKVLDNGKTLDVSSTDCDDIECDLLTENDLQLVKSYIAEELEGKRTQLWSDNYLDEPSVIEYITIINGQPFIHSYTESLIGVIDTNVDIWKVELEYYN